MLMNPAFEIDNTKLVKYTGNDADIIIPDGITEIGERAFAGNDKIVSVKMPDSVVKIESNAFNKCTKLKTVEFSRNLEEIGYEAFCRCKALKEIELPDTIRYLGGAAFASCDKLRSIRCESKVFEPGSDPFSSYDEKTPPALIDKDGFLIFMNVLFKFVDTGNAKEIIVPDGVTHIVSSVFRNNSYSWAPKSSMEKVVLPASVREIGATAFANCRDLKHIEMPTGINVGLKAFVGCCSLGDENGFFIHDGVVLGYYGDSDTLHIPQGVHTIAQEVFCNGYESNPGNKKIRSVVLPEGLETIGAMAFQNCDLLEQVEIPESVHTIGNSAFAGCDHLARVQLPAHIENMGDGVFNGCRRLADEDGFSIFNNTLYGFFGSERHVTVPEGITAISNGCFTKMGIISVTLPSTLMQLGNAFEGCDMLEEIVIPEGIEAIPSACFRHCTNLKSVTLPSTLKSIGYAAFAGCTALERIEFPDALERIDNSAFSQCSALKEIVIPAGLKFFGKYVFENCYGLEQVTLPEGQETIESSCFLNCKSLKEIRIPASVKSIEYMAFSGCESLGSLRFDNFSCTVDPTAFSKCDKLADKDGFIIVGDILWRYIGAGGNVVVPDGVRELAADVFREGYCRNFRYHISYRTTGSLKSLTLPATLKVIGENALDGCSKVTNLVIPEGVQTIKDYAFCESGLRKVGLPDSLQELGEGVFCGCKNLTSAKLPEHTRVISKEMFRDCTALPSFTVPSGVTHIGEDAFRGCKSLMSVDVHPENGAYASRDGILTSKAGDELILFPAARNIVSYEIPDHFRTIGKHAFISCEKLTKIVIPASVQNIGDEAFPRRDWRGTTGLTVIEAAPAAGRGEIGENVFDLAQWSDKPLCHPKLPIAMAKEQSVQLLLGLAFCLNPEKYEEIYAEGYRKYTESHEKSLLKKADALHLPEAAKYFGSKPGSKKKAINYKKLSDQAKVELLEQAVLPNDIEQAKTVIAGCGGFEFTARALGLACLYSSLDMVKLLVENGATFEYEYTSLIKRRYGAAYCTKYSQYPVNYSELIAKTGLNTYNPIMFASLHEYHFAELPSCSATMNRGKTRADIAEYLCSVESAKFNASAALCCALFWGCTELAERLLQLGTSLPSGTVIALSDTDATADRMEYMLCLAALKPEKALFALQKLADILDALGKTIIMMPKAFDEKKTSLLDATLIPFIFSRTDTSRLTKSKLLERATDQDDVQAVAALVNAGIFKTAAMRDKAIQYAMDNNKTEVLAWLMDYTNKTADLAAEEARKEERIMRELLEDPNSVSALKKIWGYKKLEDGTLQITSYKGSEEHVVIPEKIGKSKVTVIGNEAFFGSEYGRSKHYQGRRKIKSIQIPEGVTEIGDHAFSLCESLESIVIPSSVKVISVNAFNNCPKLRDAKGFLILNGVLYGYVSPNREYQKVVIPEGVKKIGPGVFKAEWSSNVYHGIQSLVLPESLEEIGESAFKGLKGLKTLHIPAGVVTIGNGAFADSALTTVTFSEGVKTICDCAFKNTALVSLHLPDSLESIGARALYSCQKLRDLYIPATLQNIGEELLGSYGDSEVYSWSHFVPSGIYVYTPAGSAAETYMKQYSTVYVSNEYPEKETKG